MVYNTKNSNEQTSWNKKILQALNDDLNTPVAFAIIDEFINYANENLNQNPKNKNLKKEIISSINFIDKVIGIGSKDPYEYFQFGITPQEKQQILLLIEQRDIAKKNKNYQQADNIREQLKNMGINIMDTPNGCVWEKNY